MLFFEILVIVIFILNIFVSSILSKYVNLLVLSLVFGLYVLFFGLEKNRKRYWKLLSIDVIIYLLTFFVFYYLLGIIVGFTKTNIHLVKTFVYDVLPLFTLIIIKELLRYNMLMKSEGSWLNIIVTIIFFILIDISEIVAFASLSSNYSIFVFVAVGILPIISRNILCSYLSYNVGYKPSILYLIITQLYMYFVPIIPNPNEYLYSIIWMIFPIICLYFLYCFFKKEKDEEELQRKNKNKLISLVLPLILVMFLVYITSGYFHYHAIAVGSGSMTPNILKGDVVVIEKIKDYDKVNIGQVIAFKKDKIIVVHRLINKVYVDGEYYFYTKGDANDFVDNFQITEDMFIGIVDIKIPYVGYPTVWLNNL